VEIFSCSSAFSSSSPEPAESPSSDDDPTDPEDEESAGASCRDENFGFLQLDDDDA